jgi:hypothetical protein
MDTTHDDNAATWRNLTDQLTPEQIEKLAVMEQRSRMSAEETARALLEGAREAATGNVIDSVIFGDVERPADARRFYTWEDQWETGLWMRSFEGTERNIGPGVHRGLSVPGRTYPAKHHHRGSRRLRRADRAPNCRGHHRSRRGDRALAMTLRLVVRS